MKELVRECSFFGSLLVFVSIVFALSLFHEWVLVQQLIIGLAILYFVVVLIRHVWHRDRPTPRAYTNWLERIDASSFPSLHSARSAFLALLIWTRFPPLGGLLLVLVFLTGYSRYATKHHHVSDIVAGYALGLLVFLAV